LAGVEVSPVGSRPDLAAFVDFPWVLYREDPRWVPPIKSELAKLLTPGRHPFWDHAERELFLARRGDVVVGRIAAIIDRNYNSFRNEKMGSFGFFETQNDPESAMALFTAAEDWLRARDVGFMRGPQNPSTNYEVGLLVEGFEHSPSVMMTYNRPFYGELISLCGFRKEKDLLAFRYSRGDPLPAQLFETSTRLFQKGEITIRTGDRRRLKEDLLLMNRIYAECWSRNWGFVPMTDAELTESARLLMHIVDIDFAFFVCHQGEPVGVCLFVPDVNPLLKRFNGSLGLLSLLKMLFYWSSDVTGVRGLLFGVKEEYRQTGVPLISIAYLHELLTRKPRYLSAEMGWTLEDNQSINLLFNEFGLKPIKRYRIYRKDFEDLTHGVCDT